MRWRIWRGMGSRLLEFVICLIERMFDYESNTMYKIHKVKLERKKHDKVQC